MNLGDFSKRPFFSSAYDTIIDLHEEIGMPLKENLTDQWLCACSSSAGYTLIDLDEYIDLSPRNVHESLTKLTPEVALKEAHHQSIIPTILNHKKSNVLKAHMSNITKHLTIRELP